MSTAIFGQRGMPVVAAMAMPLVPLPLVACGGESSRWLGSLDRPVSSLGLAFRASNALSRAGIQTVGEVVQWSVRDLKTLPGFGPASVIALTAALNAMNLSLREAERIFGR